MSSLWSKKRPKFGTREKNKQNKWMIKIVQQNLMHHLTSTFNVICKSRLFWTAKEVLNVRPYDVWALTFKKRPMLGIRGSGWMVFLLHRPTVFSVKIRQPKCKVNNFTRLIDMGLMTGWRCEKMCISRCTVQHWFFCDIK